MSMKRTHSRNMVRLIYSHVIDLFMYVVTESLKQELDNDKHKSNKSISAIHTQLLKHSKSNTSLKLNKT